MAAVDEIMACDLCKKLPANHGAYLPELGAKHNVVWWCWRCSAKLPADSDQAMAAIRSVLLDGQSLNLAVMFATGEGPRLVTDDTFFRGWRNAGGAQFDGDVKLLQDGYMLEAKRRGVSTNGKVYMHGLAEYPGDPRAWVSSRGEIKKILEENGWGCERLGVEARPGPPEPDVPLAPDLVEQFVDRRIEAEGLDKRRLKKERLAEMRAEAAERHGRKKPPGDPPPPKRRGPRGKKRPKPTA